jgi:hypothetical protein
LEVAIMALYIIRVELHDAQWQHYVEMAKDLATKGITDVIAGSDGNSYKMPPAEYNYVGSENIDAVFDAVRASANKTGKSNAVFVTEATRTKWVGMEVVSARRTA